VPVTLNKKCRAWPACGIYGVTSDCVTISNSVPANEEIVLVGAVYTYCQPRSVTETIYGIDSNGNLVSSSHTFTLSGC
jgi:hypothetical protein